MRIMIGVAVFALGAGMIDGRAPAMVACEHKMRGEAQAMAHGGIRADAPEMARRQQALDALIEACAGMVLVGR